MEYYPHIVCDPDKCTGCRMCELACSMAQEGAFAPLLSRIRNVRIEPVIQMTVSCQLCKDPPCVIACPRKALSQSEETGIIIVDEDLCNGCGWCIEA
ncbi:MAG: 4Fe-4S dicluster domain-containing protein, partial [Chloroflexota bacterium]|nr:4Fe-4S dicluster domain-containing protein [Chloroflexota bacterium]